MKILEKLSALWKHRAPAEATCNLANPLEKCVVCHGQLEDHQVAFLGSVLSPTDEETRFLRAFKDRNWHILRIHDDWDAQWDVWEVRLLRCTARNAIVALLIFSPEAMTRDNSLEEHIQLSPEDMIAVMEMELPWRPTYVKRGSWE
jgi:hypothetical protein